MTKTKQQSTINISYQAKVVFYLEYYTLYCRNEASNQIILFKDVE